ncbi:MAG TPA: hypothetical protein PK129_18375, partial [Cellvibrionaceae bacterium]|nr:hypothetical protein [Cellvibrionaceae bacterium]
MTPSEPSVPPQPSALPHFTRGGAAQSRLALAAPVPWGAGEVAQLELDLAGRAGDPVAQRR